MNNNKKKKDNCKSTEKKDPAKLNSEYQDAEVPSTSSSSGPKGSTTGPSQFLPSSDEFDITDALVADTMNQVVEDIEELRQLIIRWKAEAQSVSNGDVELANRYVHEKTARYLNKFFALRRAFPHQRQTIPASEATEKLSSSSPIQEKNLLKMAVSMMKDFFGIKSENAAENPVEQKLEKDTEQEESDITSKPISSECPSVPVHSSPQKESPLVQAEPSDDFQAPDANVEKTTETADNLMICSSETQENENLETEEMPPDVDEDLSKPSLTDSGHSSCVSDGTKQKKYKRKQNKNIMKTMKKNVKGFFRKKSKNKDEEPAEQHLETDSKPEGSDSLSGSPRPDLVGPTAPLHSSEHMESTFDPDEPSQDRQVVEENADQTPETAGSFINSRCETPENKNLGTPASPLPTSLTKTEGTPQDVDEDCSKTSLVSSGHSSCASDGSDDKSEFRKSKNIFKTMKKKARDFFGLKSEDKDEQSSEQDQESDSKPEKSDSSSGSSCPKDVSSAAFDQDEPSHDHQVPEENADQTSETAETFINSRCETPENKNLGTPASPPPTSLTKTEGTSQDVDEDGSKISLTPSGHSSCASDGSDEKSEFKKSKNIFKTMKTKARRFFGLKSEDKDEQSSEQDLESDSKPEKSDSSSGSSCPKHVSSAAFDRDEPSHDHQVPEENADQTSEIAERFIKSSSETPEEESLKTSVSPFRTSLTKTEGTSQDADKDGSKTDSKPEGSDSLSGSPCPDLVGPTAPLHSSEHMESAFLPDEPSQDRQVPEEKADQTTEAADNFINSRCETPENKNLQTPASPLPTTLTKTEGTSQDVDEDGSKTSLTASGHSSCASDGSDEKSEFKKSKNIFKTMKKKARRFFGLKSEDKSEQSSEQDLETFSEREKSESSSGSPCPYRVCPTASLHSNEHMESTFKPNEPSHDHQVPEENADQTPETAENFINSRCETLNNENLQTPASPLPTSLTKTEGTSQDVDEDGSKTSLVASGHSSCVSDGSDEKSEFKKSKNIFKTMKKKARCFFGLKSEDKDEQSSEQDQESDSKPEKSDSSPASSCPKHVSPAPFDPNEPSQDHQVVEEKADQTTETAGSFINSRCETPENKNLGTPASPLQTSLTKTEGTSQDVDGDSSKTSLAAVAHSSCASVGTHKKSKQKQTKTKGEPIFKTVKNKLRRFLRLKPQVADEQSNIKPESSDFSSGSVSCDLTLSTASLHYSKHQITETDDNCIKSSCETAFVCENMSTPVFLCTPFLHSTQEITEDLNKDSSKTSSKESTHSSTVYERTNKKCKRKQRKNVFTNLKKKLGRFLRLKPFNKKKQSKRDSDMDLESDISCASSSSLCSELMFTSSGERTESPTHDPFFYGENSDHITVQADEDVTSSCASPKNSMFTALVKEELAGKELKIAVTMKTTLASIITEYFQSLSKRERKIMNVSMYNTDPSLDLVDTLHEEFLLTTESVIDSMVGRIFMFAPTNSTE